MLYADSAFSFFSTDSKSHYSVLGTTNALEPEQFFEPTTSVDRDVQTKHTAVKMIVYLVVTLAHRPQLAAVFCVCFRQLCGKKILGCTINMVINFTKYVLVSQHCNRFHNIVNNVMMVIKLYSSRMSLESYEPYV